MRGKWRTSLAAACVLALASGPVAAVDTEGETFDSAVFLLKSCTRVRRDGRHHMLLRALRHLADPELAPLFDSLIESTYTPFKIHGFLGAAECDPDRKLDLTRIAALDNGAEQAQIISAAMDSGLLSDDQARQLINWEGLENAIKVVVATQLLRSGQFDQRQILETAAQSENLARRYLGLFLLGQNGDAAALARLDELSLSDDPERDRVREMLLRTAVQRQLGTVGPWALRVSAEPKIGQRLRSLALKTALRFQAPGADGTWRRRFEAATDVTERKRLALMVLDLSPRLAPQLFEPLIGYDDAFVDRVGRTGQAVASKRHVAEAVSALVEMNYAITNAWALRYARDDANAQDVAVILVALIGAYDKGPDRGRSQRLDDAVSATQLFFERDPDGATPFLRSILSSSASDPLLVQGVLLGLIHCGTPDPHVVLDGLPPFKARAPRNLALLLRARFGQGLPAEALRDLGLMVRGGGLRQGALRVQAAWLYLKITNQVEPALAQVLSD